MGGAHPSDMHAHLLQQRASPVLQAHDGPTLSRAISRHPQFLLRFAQVVRNFWGKIQELLESGDVTAVFGNEDEAREYLAGFGAAGRKGAPWLDHQRPSLQTARLTPHLSESLLSHYKCA